jgi:hypothetical protein
MPLYFFHVRLGELFAPDPEGTELTDFPAALAEARNMARDLAIEDLKDRQDIADRSIEIIDNHGDTVGMLRARDILKPEGE